MISLYDFTGLTGVALSVYSYARVQWQREYAKNIGYSLLNLAAAILVGVSLLNSWSLAAFVGSAASAVLSMYGVYRCLKYMRRENPENSINTNATQLSPLAPTPLPPSQATGGEGLPPLPCE